MKDIKNLYKSLEKIEEELQRCTSCGLCQSICPVFKESLNEGDVARGKIALLKGLREKLIKDTKNIKYKIERCLLCNSCYMACPRKVPGTRLFTEARIILTEYEKLSLTKKIIFRLILSRGYIFDLSVKLAAFFQKFIIKDRKTPQKTSSAPAFMPFLGKRHFSALATNSFHREYRKLEREPGNIKVLFYTGCLVDKIYSEIGKASLKAFKHHKVEVILNKRHICCGMPSLSSGDIKSFKELLLQNLKELSDKKFDYLVSPCPSCTANIRESWPLMAEKLKLKEEKAIRELSLKTMDINQFFINIIKVETSPPLNPEVLTFHDPCHLKKSLNIYREPRQLIQANGNYLIKEMKNADFCCGMGGSFNIQHYEISSKIGEKKREDIVSTEAEIVGTSCPACIMQLSEMLSKNQDHIKVKHSIELYAEGL